MPIAKRVKDSSDLDGALTSKKLAITVLAGGPSGEREISLESGHAVSEALRSLGHVVHLEDISPDNLSALAREADCVFVALHGRFGEDGAVQRILERRSLRYCGSGPESCALAMNKARAKQRFVELGLPTPRFAVADSERIQEAVAAWSLPVVAKPVKEGSSLYCTIIRQFEAFRPSVERVIDRYGTCLIEEYVPGLEISIGILGSRSLPPIEIRTPRDFYDYEAKYVDNRTEYLFDIDLPTELLDRIAAMSLEAHNKLGCRDFSRVDWRVNTTTLEPYLLEVNVIPGLTGHSLLPKAAERVGISMPEMCQMIVTLALKRRYGQT